MLKKRAKISYGRPRAVSNLRIDIFKSNLKTNNIDTMPDKKKIQKKKLGKY